MRRVGLRILTGLAVAGSAEAQQPAAFDEAYTAAEALRGGGDADPEEIRRAYGRALRAFLTMEPTAAAYGERLPAGGFCAFQSGDPGLAAELWAEAEERLGSRAFLAEWRVRALVDAGSVKEAVAVARRHEEGFPEAVHRALAAGAGGLLPVAGRWLRAGRTDEALWIFAALVRATDRDPVMLGNHALALRHLGREEDCERVYREALERAPADAVLWNDYGLFLRGVGRLEEAAEVFARSHSLDERPGEGPGITNLVHMAVWAPRLVPESPAEDAARALAVRPDADVLRRVTLDLLLAPEDLPGSRR